MSRWSKRVAQAMRRQAVIQGIAAVATEWMTSHIDNNVGRGPGGQGQGHLPLKSISGRYWTNRKPKGATVVQTETKMVPVPGKPGRKRRRVRYLIEQPSYRNGGTPLRNTGKLERSLSAKGRTDGDKIRLTMRGLKYGLYQDRGFTTKGPNYIPLTLKGRRKHATGNNPNAEGLKRGKDFFMAKKGVTVPSRPFILPTRRDLRILGRSIYLGLRTVLKGP